MYRKIIALYLRQMCQLCSNLILFLLLLIIWFYCNILHRKKIMFKSTALSAFKRNSLSQPVWQTYILSWYLIEQFFEEQRGYKNSFQVKLFSSFKNFCFHLFVSCFLHCHYQIKQLKFQDKFKFKIPLKYILQLQSHTRNTIWCPKKHVKDVFFTW